MERTGEAGELVAVADKLGAELVNREECVTPYRAAIV